MSQGWTTVFMGPVAEAELLRSELESRRIPAFIPDDWIRTLDPFAVGGLLVFDRAVQVPPSAIAQARACLEAHGEDREIGEGEQELPADFFEDGRTADEALLSRASMLSRRIRWASILAIGLPFVLWEIGPYLESVKRLGRKPPLHRTTILAALISPMYCLQICWWILMD